MHLDPFTHQAQTEVRRFVNPVGPEPSTVVPNIDAKCRVRNRESYVNMARLSMLEGIEHAFFRDVISNQLCPWRRLKLIWPFN
jgi:hypothetical protein